MQPGFHHLHFYDLQAFTARIAAGKFWAGGGLRRSCVSQSRDFKEGHACAGPPMRTGADEESSKASAEARLAGVKTRGATWRARRGTWQDYGRNATHNLRVVCCLSHHVASAVRLQGLEAAVTFCSLLLLVYLSQETLATEVHGSKGRDRPEGPLIQK